MPVLPQRQSRPSRPRRSGGVLAGTLLASVLLAACANGGGSPARTWVPQPAVTLEPNPVVPGAGPTSSGQPTSAPSGSTPTSPRSPGQSPAATDPAVVAKGLSAPVGIAVLPDGTALVGEQVSGVIVRVQPLPNQPVTTVRTLSGLDASASGGLHDLALSPTYDQDHLIYAYVTTKTDNRVVDFTLTGPVTPVFTGIPRGASDNAGRIAFGVDGNLYVGTGDAGVAANAQNPASLAGKVLEVNSVGQPVNASLIFASGLHAIAGLCVDTNTGAIFETEPNAPASPGTYSTSDEINRLTKGDDFGWPSHQPASVAPITTLPLGSDGQPPIAAGCAVSDGALYVASLHATSLYSAAIVHPAQSQVVNVEAFDPPALTDKYGQLITVAVAPDGSLWLATANKGVTPAPPGASTDDERILHIAPTGGGTSSQT